LFVGRGVERKRKEELLIECSCHFRLNFLDLLHLEFEKLRSAREKGWDGSEKKKRKDELVFIPWLYKY
jgi:hypothetical protein